MNTVSEGAVALRDRLGLNKAPRKPATPMPIQVFPSIRLADRWKSIHLIPDNDRAAYLGQEVFQIAYVYDLEVPLQENGYPPILDQVQRDEPLGEYDPDLYTTYRDISLETAKALCDGSLDMSEGWTVLE